jgi:N-acetylglucosamine-6-sulfatase
LAAAGLPVLVNATFSERTSAEARPNILLIMVDDLPYPAVRFLEKTKKRVRDEGVNLSNTFASTPICGPSRASLLTGLYAHNHRIFFNDKAGEKMLSAGLHRDSIATRVKEQGYATGMFGKFQNEHPPAKVPEGWDRFVSMHEPYNDDEYIAVSIDGTPQRVDRRGNNESAWLSNQAKEFVNRRRDAPWFCYVAPHSPHSPSHAALNHQREAEGTPLYPTPARSEEDLSDKPAWIRNREASSTQELRQRYEGVVAETLDVDELVNEMIDALSATGQLENTYIIFTNDNGYAFGEHKLEGKPYPYDVDTRLPLFVRGPGIKAGGNIEDLVSLVDVTATVIDLAGGPWKDLDGRSLVPLLSDGEASWRSRLLIENFMSHTWRVVRDKRYVYIRDEEGDFEQLYDMVEDPHQMESISWKPSASSIMERKRTELAALRDARGSRLRDAEE